MSIIQISTPHEISHLVELIRTSFLTVALDFKLTKENAPTNPAFITENDIHSSLAEKDISFYGYFEHNKLIGCYALENAGKGTYYLERLAIHPKSRHGGIGKQLILDAFARVKRCGGIKISIAIINENTRLKTWYENLGFIVTNTKSFPHLPFTVCFLEINF